VCGCRVHPLCAGVVCTFCCVHLLHGGVMCTFCMQVSCVPSLYGCLVHLSGDSAQTARVHCPVFSCWLKAKSVGKTQKVTGCVFWKAKGQVACEEKKKTGETSWYWVTFLLVFSNVKIIKWRRNRLLHRWYWGSQMSMSKRVNSGSSRHRVQKLTQINPRSNRSAKSINFLEESESKSLWHYLEQ
jgi:hypothetical protein